MEDRIEQRITIRATQDKVWHLVTRPGWWLPGSKAEPARGPGRVAVAYGGDSRPYVIDVVRVEPQGYASFRWASAFGGAEPAPGNATLVEFYLRPVGDEIGVTVVESGFARSTCRRRCARTSGRATRAAGSTSSRACGPGRSKDDAPTRTGCSPRWRMRAGASCWSCSRGAPGASAGGAGGRCCRSPGRRSRSTWPCSRRLASSPAGGRGGRCCSAVRPDGLTATAGWLAARARPPWLGPDRIRADQGKDPLL